jgi:hypothetical protein
MCPVTQFTGQQGVATTPPISRIGALMSAPPIRRKRRLDWRVLQKLQTYLELKSEWKQF